MIKYYWVEQHDYMDMHPQKHLYTFSGDENAKAWEKHMRENYSGGTTRVILPALTECEARHEVAKLIWQERRNPQPDTPEFIEKLLKTIKEAYK